MNVSLQDRYWYVHVGGVVVGIAAAVLFPLLLPPHTAAWDVLRYTANLYGGLGLAIGLIWPRVRWHWLWWLGVPLLAEQTVAMLLGRGAIWASPDLLRLLIAVFAAGVGSQFGVFLGSKLRPGGSRLEPGGR